MCNLSSSTRDRTCTPCNRSLKSQLLDRQGKSLSQEVLSQGSPYLQEVPISEKSLSALSCSERIHYPKRKPALVDHSPILPALIPEITNLYSFSMDISYKYMNNTIMWPFMFGFFHLTLCFFFKLTHVEHV